MTAYDPAIIERLCREAREEDTRTAVWLRVVADQLEAASARLDDVTDALHQRRDEVAKLTAERDALRAEVERLKSAFAATAQQLHDACLDCGCARFVRTQLDEATAPTAGKEGE